MESMEVTHYFKSGPNKDHSNSMLLVFFFYQNMHNRYKLIENPRGNVELLIVTQLQFKFALHLTSN